MPPLLKSEQFPLAQAWFVVQGLPVCVAPVQTPLWQVWPVVQTWPQAPQLLASVSSLVQALWQQVRPLVH
jgi:hypothetical protein